MGRSPQAPNARNDLPQRIQFTTSVGTYAKPIIYYQMNPKLLVSDISKSKSYRGTNPLNRRTRAKTLDLVEIQIKIKREYDIENS